MAQESSESTTTEKKIAETTRTELTPLQTIFIGSTVLVAGAALSGGTYYVSTAKKLAEEGIAPSARIKAMPVAAQALAMSTLLCIALGGAALAAWHTFGMESRDIAQVASFSDAVAIAKQQRVRTFYLFICYVCIVCRQAATSHYTTPSSPGFGE